MEEFKRCVHDDLKVFLNERQIDTVYDIATLANEYTLTCKRGKPKTNNPFENGSCTNPRIGTSAGPNARPGQINHAYQSSSPRNKPHSHNPHPPIYRRTDRGNALTCYCCGKVGHIAVNCLAKKGTESRNAFPSKPQRFISSCKNLVKEKEDNIRSECRPFMSNGSVYPLNDPTTKTRIKILRHWGNPVSDFRERQATWTENGHGRIFDNSRNWQ